RLAMYAQDWLDNHRRLVSLLGDLRGKGLKGAVGTQAGFVEILEDTGLSAEQLEALAMARLDLPYFSVTSQTYTRQQDLRVVQELSAIAASLHKFALDFRILQS